MAQVVENDLNELRDSAAFFFVGAEAICIVWNFNVILNWVSSCQRL